MFDFMNLAWTFGNRGYYISSYDIDDAMDSVMMGILIGLIGVGIIAWGIFYFLKKSDNNKQLIVKRIKILEILPVNHLVGWYIVECEDGERLKLRSFEPNKLLVSVGDIGILGYRGQTIQTFNREGVRKRNF